MNNLFRTVPSSSDKHLTCGSLRPNSLASLYVGILFLPFTFVGDVAPGCLVPCHGTRLPSSRITYELLSRVFQPLLLECGQVFSLEAQCIIFFLENMKDVSCFINSELTVQKGASSYVTQVYNLFTTGIEHLHCFICSNIYKCFLIVLNLGLECHVKIFFKSKIILGWNFLNMVLDFFRHQLDKI